MKDVVGIIDYGVGNLRSVISDFEAVDAKAELVTDPGRLGSYATLILPGVGSFQAAKKQFLTKGFFHPLNEVVETGGTSLLGICVGMQLLASLGEEGSETAGLGYIPGEVRRFSSQDLALKGLKIPHVGFDEVCPIGPSDLFNGLGDVADFYFTHSYRIICADPADVLAVCNHGEVFAAVVKHKNVVGAQFHPEKSQSNGLRFLKNFLASARCQRNA